MTLHRLEKFAQPINLKRVVREADHEILELRQKNVALAGCLELIREGIRIGAIPNMIVCPKGGGTKEIRLMHYIDEVLKLGGD